MTNIIFKIWEDPEDPFKLTPEPKYLDLTNIEDINKLKISAGKGNSFLITHIKGCWKDENGKWNIDEIVLEET